MFKKYTKQGGFTILELLVVIGIIGLLASIIVINLTNARRRARDIKRIADIRQMQTVTEDYYGKNGKYPTLIGDLVTGSFIPMWPLDPLAPAGTVCVGNSNYCYWYASYTPPSSGGPQSYHFGASLEDTTNALLNQDRDCNSINGTNCPYVAAYANGFNGSDANGCDSVAGRACYDVAQ